MMYIYVQYAVTRKKKTDPVDIHTHIQATLDKFIAMTKDNEKVLQYGNYCPLQSLGTRTIYRYIL
jgi:IS30 family transposase